MDLWRFCLLTCNVLILTCSALFASILPNASLIFRSLFMSQCKLIYADSALKRRSVQGWRVDFWDCVCSCVCHCLNCACVVSSKMHSSNVRSDMDFTAYLWSLCIVARKYRHCEHPDISCLRLPWHCSTQMHRDACVEKSILSWLCALDFPCQLHSEMPEDNTK